MGPTRSSAPNSIIHDDNARYPAEVVANDSTPNNPPAASTTAATWTSKCVSTPPTTGRAEPTMVMAIPFLSEGWHARPVKETVDRGAVAAAPRDHPPERGVSRPCSKPSIPGPAITNADPPSTPPFSLGIMRSARGGLDDAGSGLV